MFTADILGTSPVVLSGVTGISFDSTSQILEMTKFYSTPGIFSHIRMTVIKKKKRKQKKRKSVRKGVEKL